MVKMMTFNTLWSDLELESSQISQQGILTRLVGLEKTCPTFIGIRRPGKLRCYIVQVPIEIALLPESIPNSRGFEFHVSATGNELHSGYVSCILTASQEDYNDVFSSIAEDLFSITHSLSSKREIVKAFFNRVRLWQIFFEKQNASGLSEEAQRGLFGELIFLDTYVLINKNSFIQDLDNWTGPINRQHDFQFGNLVVEVKTTSSKNHQRLTISSEQQLDETLVDALYVFFISLSIIEDHENTLPAKVETIRNRLSSDPLALAQFNTTLVHRGYLDAHKEKYDRTGYSEREAAFFHVKDQFPRIKENDLRKGVGEIKYSILVSECKNYEIPKDEFTKKLKEAR